MKLIRLYIFFILILLFQCCSLQEVEKGHQTGDVDLTITIPRIHPYLNQVICDSSSRAYAVADRIHVVIEKDGEVIKDEEYSISEVYGYDHEDYDTSFELLYLLDAGDNYKISVESFNLENSNTVPTVVGESNIFTVTDGEIIDVSLTLKPKDAKNITLGTPETENTFKHFELDRYSSMLSTGSEHWYKVKAESKFTAVEHRTHPVSYMGMSVDYPTSRAFIFDLNGRLVDTQARDNEFTVFKSEIDQYYYICILPVALEDVDTPVRDSEIVFSVNNYIDDNDSKDSADTLPNSFINGIFHGHQDVDYYKGYIESGRYQLNLDTNTELAGSNLSNPNSMKVEVFSDDNSLVSSISIKDSVYIDIAISGNYYLKLTNLNTSLDALDHYYISVNKVELSEANSFSSWIDLDRNEQFIYYLGYDVEGGKEYQISSKHANNSPDYSGYISYKMIYFKWDGDNKYFTEEAISDSSSGSNWSNLIATIPQGVTDAYLKVYITSGRTSSVIVEEYNP